MMRFSAFLVLMALCACASDRPTKPSYEGYMDCAAAYRANSQIKDPDRPATMVRDMADVGEDYAKAARVAYARKTGAKPQEAQAAVEAEVAGRTAVFAKRSRAQIEHFIEGCPQTGE